MTMPHLEPDKAPGRHFTPCPSLTPRFSVEELIQTCESCDRFYTRCCQHPSMNPCHHSPLVYTDGACSNNGKLGAVAGIGIAFGNSTGNAIEPYQFSFPVDDRLDPDGYRTNQRAELLAALVGLQKICDYEEERMENNSARRGSDDRSPVPIVVATDSEYVVLGMTEWLPSWKKNNFRKSGGKRPSNLDLFLRLDAEVEERERNHEFEIKFWHIGRTYNGIADRLAKLAVDAAIRRGSEGSRAVEYLTLMNML